MGLTISGFNVTGNLTAVHIPSSFLSPTDTYFKYTSLLLSGNGTNGAQNNTFLDGSTNNFTLTRNGNITQGTFSPYGSNWSNYFDGTGDYIRTASLVLNNSAFTISFYFYPTSSSVIGLFDSGPNQFSCFRNYPANTIQDQNGGSVAFTPLVNQWNWMSIVGDGTNFTVYLNGSSAGSAAYASLVDSNFTIGAINSGGDGAYTGYISNFRIKNVASVDSVPTTPLTAIAGTSLLTCQSNRLIDNSTNAFAITRNGDVSVQRFSPFSPTDAYSVNTIGGSGYFDGSGDFLTVNSGFHFGTRDFTIECWLNPDVQYADGSGVSIFTGETSGSGLTWGMGFQSYAGYNGLTFSYGQYGSYTVGKYVNGYWGTKGVWSHIVFQRRSGVIQCYINGVLQTLSTYNEGGSFSDSVNISGNNTTKGIGTSHTGYISNLRVLDGTGLYSGNFTPPTEPLTAVANTSLLLNFTNAGIIDNAMMTTMETIGNAQISTAQSKFGSGSMYFDGTGDYLSIPSTQNLNFGTGDFTVEAWVYPNSLATDWFIISASGSGGFFFGFSKDTVTGFGWGRTAVAWDYRVADTGTAGTWQHVAISRSGTSMRIFVNGTQIGTTQTNSTSYNLSTTSTTVGSQGSGYYLNGYIDDLRVTKGYARYTANFTPPTAALETL